MYHTANGTKTDKVVTYWIIFNWARVNLPYALQTESLRLLRLGRLHHHRLGCRPFHRLDGNGLHLHIGFFNLLAK